VNTHATDRFEVSVTVSSSSSSSSSGGGSCGRRGGGGLVVARGEGRTVDSVPPLTAQVVQVVSPDIGAEGWGYSTSQGIKVPSPVAAAQSPPAPPGSLHAPTPLIG
jgi:hypothetical protein